jgi:chromosome segregation ATPase
MTAQNGDLGRQLGRLEGRLEAVGGDVGGLKEEVREMRAQSTQEHSEVRDSVARAVETIETRLTSRLNKHSEEIDDLQESRAKGRGIILLLLSASTVAAAAAAVLGVTGTL